MSDFKAKMYQIRFPLRLAPDPAGGAYSAPQTSLEKEGKGEKGGGERPYAPPVTPLLQFTCYKLGI